jgi:hypothetical protein
LDEVLDATINKLQVYEVNASGFSNDGI